MKKTLTTTLLAILMCVCMVFGFAACGNKCDHAYDNACDAICNKCNETREVGEHVPEEDDGNCTTDQICTVCEWVLVEAKYTHTDVALDGTCDVCYSAVDFVFDSESFTYHVFTAEGLYTWAYNLSVLVDGVTHYTNLSIKKDIVLPDEMRFDLDKDGINESNWSPLNVNGVLIDGNGHSITSMTMNTEGVNFLAFLSRLSEDSVVQNIFLKDITVKGGSPLGGIASSNYGTIINCGVSGTINAAGSNVGGIAGSVFNGNVIACYSDVNITSTAGSVGGIVGQCYSEGSKIIACYNTGSVISTGSSTGGIGGGFYSGKLIATYSTGYIESRNQTGGIVGYSTVAISAAYWSTTGDSPVLGNGYNGSDSNCIRVDGETVNWEQAMNAMNATLEQEDTEWRYALNTGADASIRPLILVQQSAN